MEGQGFGVGLITKDILEVSTDHGPCEIQLTYGSVTSLSKENEVDVLVVSAFPSKIVSATGPHNFSDYMNNRKDFILCPLRFIIYFFQMIN